MQILCKFFAALVTGGLLYYAFLFLYRIINLWCFYDSRPQAATNWARCKHFYANLLLQVANHPISGVHYSACEWQWSCEMCELRCSRDTRSLNRTQEFWLQQWKNREWGWCGFSHVWENAAKSSKISTRGPPTEKHRWWGGCESRSVSEAPGGAAAGAGDGEPTAIPPL